MTGTTEKKIIIMNVISASKVKGKRICCGGEINTSTGVDSFVIISLKLKRAKNMLAVAIVILSASEESRLSLLFVAAQRNNLRKKSQLKKLPRTKREK